MRLPLVALLLAVPFVAHAQPGADDPPDAPPPPPDAPPPPTTTPPPQPIIVAPPAPPPSTVDLGVVNDANSGRNWFAPTALTPPAGTWSFTDYQILMISGGYAITDQLSISATTLLPAFSEMPFWGMLSAKYQVVRQGNVRVALQGAIIHFAERDDDLDDGSFTVGNAGAALTACIDKDCNSHVTGYLGAGFGSENDSIIPLVASVGATLRLGRHVKAVFELDTAFVIGDINESSDFYLGWYGVRFTSKSIGVDLGFARPICDGCEDITDELPMGFPFISFTYRAFKE